MYIYLDILQEFSCEMCGSCCRKEWAVTLDEESYERNLRLFTATDREEEFKKIFIPLTDKKGLGEYAYIAKKTSGGCWFLTEHNHCRLQKEAGHEHLDHVCQIYPRYPMDTARGTELTLSFSCPAVLKLASRSEPLRIIRAEKQPIMMSSDHEVAYVYPQQQPAGSPLRYYFEIEQHFIDIMQCRSITIDGRLLMIMETAQKIDQLTSHEELGQQLNQIIYENYEVLDKKAMSEETFQSEPANLLLENFFVNFIFKKPFYIYGLSRTVKLLLAIWKRIKEACTGSKDCAMECTKAIIMEVEFEYSHNRKALFKENL